MTDITESDRKIIDQLREDVKDLMTPDYDHDYNYLRYVKGWSYNIDTARYYLRRHLKVRKVFHFDTIDELEDDEIIKHHFPSGLLGTTGKDNKILMIEMVGRTDVRGLLKSIQGTEFFRYRMKYFEKFYAKMYEQEKLTQQQSGALYIFDLEGVSMDPFLITVLAGPYRILWSIIMLNYPEWIQWILIINVPTFMNVLWKTFGPLLPDITRAKVKFLPGDWKKEILNYVDPDHLPVYWGGKMVDENGDPMCRSRIVVPQGKIPQRLYWRNAGKYKELPPDQMKVKSIGAGTASLFSYFVPKAGTILNYYVNSSDDFTFAILYHEDENEKEISKMEEMFPQFEVPGNMAPDTNFFVCEKPGAYHVKLGNEKAWFLSISMKYRFTFTNPDGSPASVVPLNGTFQF